jgi:mersacidin/lichenicidin family type 2 lantibiotic
LKSNGVIVTANLYNLLYGLLPCFFVNSLWLASSHTENEKQQPVFHHNNNKLLGYKHLGELNMSFEKPLTDEEVIRVYRDAEFRDSLTPQQLVYANAHPNAPEDAIHVELSDEDLEAIAGGAMSIGSLCSVCTICSLCDLF